MSPSRPFLRALVAGSLALAVPVATLVGSPAAQAQPDDKPATDKKQQAKQYVDQGLAAQAAGRYDEALELYRKAYDLVPHPLLLFNMAQATRLAGRAIAARDLYLRYLDVEPQGVQARAAREILASLAGQIAAEEAAEQKAAEARRAEQAKEDEERKADEARRAEEQQLADEGARRAEAKKADKARRDATASGGNRGKGLRLAGMVSGGAGVLGLGVGVMFHLRASSISDELSSPGNPYDAGKDSDGESAETLSYVAFAAGGALLVGGAAMYFLGRRAGKSGERLAVLPAVSAGSFGLVVSGGLP